LAEQDIYVVFTLVLMVTMTFWNGFATLLHEDNVGLYDWIAMWLFVVGWLLFTAILAAVVCRKVRYVDIVAPTLRRWSTKSKPSKAFTPS